MIVIDGKTFNAEWQSNSLELTADIINGDNSGRLQGTKAMFLDYVGTFFNTTATIVRKKDCTDKEWDELFVGLSNPKNKHTVKIPFAQGYLTTEIYISQVKIKLINQQHNRNKWNNTIQVTFTAMKSQWLAGGKLQGFTAGV